ncbi:MAG: sulfite exporter TauE/SafE family protein, partial [Hyphomicrobiales bacterium]|nr:sulfite exporter TauE/SafE family protein [Hyphomicrobiales bacterium]
MADATFPLVIAAVAGLIGGSMNAIAGGGSFVTLPALVAAGVPSVSANATSTVALVPSALASAYAYRHDFKGFEGVSMKTMAIVSVVGGACGALLLMNTPQRVFDVIVPFLLAFGTIVFAFGRQA